MRTALAILLAAGAALAEDPAGTVPLQLQPGKTAPLETVAGSHVICDDLQVATPEYSSDGSGLVLRGVGPGTTLCGVWFGDQKPGGLYRVTVKAAPSKADGGS